MEGRVGRDNAITSPEICDKLQISENETTPQTRAVVAVLMKKRGMPIVARTGRPAGYFIAENEDEIYNYVGTLTSRMNSIEDRRRAVLDAAENSDHLSLMPDGFDDDILWN